MPAQLDQNETQFLIRLTGDVTITTADELKVFLLQSIASGKEMRINMESATSLDISIYQLLCAAERASKQAGKKFIREGVIPEEILNTYKDACVSAFPFSDC